MICRGLCACTEMLWICVLYVSFASKVRPRIFGCQWDKMCKTDGEVRGLVDCYSPSVALNTRDALYGGRCATFELHDQSTDRYVVSYVDVQSLYPYFCNNKH